MTENDEPRGHGATPPLALPDSTVPAPSAAPGLRWGVISPGHIAGQFTATAHRATASRVVSVVSRSAQRAAEFAATHGIEHSGDSVEEMLQRGGLDAVYIASPHAQHHELARPVLEAGVPVLVEKAFALNTAQSRDLLHLARERGVFAMEAMWARFLPQYDVLRQIWPTACSARSWRSLRTTASPSRWIRPTACTPRSWAAALCSASGSTRSPSRRWCWAISASSRCAATSPRRGRCVHRSARARQAGGQARLSATLRARTPPRRWSAAPWARPPLRRSSPRAP